MIKRLRSSSRSLRRLASMLPSASVVLILGLTPALALQPAGVRPEAQAGTGAPWTEPLDALDPSEPMDYFLLGEEIADAGRSPSERRLARELFGLAGALDPPRLGRSAALALADLAESDVERRRLLALATLLSEDLLQPPVTHRPSTELTVDEASLETILAVTEAFSHYRRGQGALALTALRQRNADALLDACGPALPGGAKRFREDCRNYRGALRPSLTDGEIVRLLRLEQALLAGDDRPLSADLVIESDDPLIEVDPTNLADAFGVDPSRPVRLNGRWVSEPAASSP